jgi:hypothetical protein
MPQLLLDRAYLDDVLIHDPSDSTVGYMLESAQVTRPPRRDVLRREARHGQKSRSRFFDGAVYDLAGVIVGDPATRDTRAGVLEQRLSDLARKHTFRFLRAGRQEEEQALVELVALDMPAEGFQSHVKYAVTLEADDPRIYSAALRTNTYDPTAALSGGGMAFPLTFPIEFTTTTSAYLEAINRGRLETPPVLTVHGPVVDPIVDNDTAGQSVFISYPLGVNDTVTVDVAERTVRLNGAVRADLVRAATTRWWELQPGTNRLRLRGSGMASGQTELTVTWRDAV